MGLFGKSKKKEEKKVVKTEVERVPVKYDEKGFIDIEIEDLFTLDSGNGELCFASDRITKEGFKVGFMYREEPAEGMPATDLIATRSLIFWIIFSLFSCTNFCTCALKAASIILNKPPVFILLSLLYHKIISIALWKNCL